MDLTRVGKAKLTQPEPIEQIDLTHGRAKSTELELVDHIWPNLGWRVKTDPTELIGQIDPT